MYHISMRKTSGKVIVITGGSSGIGKYLVDFFAPDNTVVSLARRAETDERNIRCDVSDPASVDAAFGIIKERYGRVDILVNNAGYGASGATEFMPDEEVERLFAVNFMGVYRCIKAALPLMEKGGRIVNISSACALFPLPFRGFYCASKAAVSMLSHSVRAEVAPYGIAVTAICPGDIKTEFTANRVKNFATDERYGERIRKADEHIAAREHKRMGLGYAGKKIAKIVSKRRYKPMYIVGKKYKFLYALCRLFPLGAVLRATGGMFAPAEKKKEK